VEYPTADHIVKFNELTLSRIRKRKADRAEVLSHSRIEECIETCRTTEGDVYDKTVSLLLCLVQKHPFASGNRRTALVIAKEFVILNGGRFGIPDDPASAKVMQGVRENYYSKEELKEWIMHGKIRAFKR
jgi:death-on-curing family protein